MDDYSDISLGAGTALVTLGMRLLRKVNFNLDRNNHCCLSAWHQMTTQPAVSYLIHAALFLFASGGRDLDMDKNYPCSLFCITSNVSISLMGKPLLLWEIMLS